jgi:hypothetical protein
VTVLRTTWAWAVRLRFLLLLLWAAPWAFRLFPRDPLGSDWWWFEYGARQLSGHAQGITPVEGGPLHLYTWLPRLQIGPPALVAAIPTQLGNTYAGRVVAAVVMVLVVIGLLFLLERIARLCGLAEDRTRAMTLVGGAFLVPAWCTLAVYTMHLDDVMVLALTVVAIHQLLRRCWWAAALVLGVAVATKPWAVAFVPLLLVVPRVRRSHALLLTVGTAAVWWLPFIVADPQTVQASGSVKLDTSPDSTLHLLGMQSSSGDARLLQLALMLLVGWLAVRSGRWPAILVAPIAVRMLTDPQTWLYYTSGLVLGAFVWDLLASRSRWPRLTLLSAALLLLESRIHLEVNGPQHDGQTFLAVARIVVLVGILVVVLWADRPTGLQLWPAAESGAESGAESDADESADAAAEVAQPGSGAQPQGEVASAQALTGSTTDER